jgi:hypothetical protein
VSKHRKLSAAALVAAAECRRDARDADAAVGITCCGVVVGTTLLVPFFFLSPQQQLYTTIQVQLQVELVVLSHHVRSTSWCNVARDGIRKFRIFPREIAPYQKVAIWCRQSQRIGEYIIYIFGSIMGECPPKQKCNGHFSGPKKELWSFLSFPFTFLNYMHVSRLGTLHFETLALGLLGANVCVAYCSLINVFYFISRQISFFIKTIN